MARTASKCDGKISQKKRSKQWIH